jgi:hypothetical protein
MGKGCFMGSDTNNMGSIFSGRNSAVSVANVMNFALE